MADDVMRRSATETPSPPHGAVPATTTPRPESRADRARRLAYRGRFTVLYFLLAVVAGAAIGTLVVLVERGSPAPRAALVRVAAGGKRGAPRRSDRRPHPRPVPDAEREAAHDRDVRRAPDRDGPGRDGVPGARARGAPEHVRRPGGGGRHRHGERERHADVQPLRPREPVLDPRGEGVERARRAPPARRSSSPSTPSSTSAGCSPSSSCSRPALTGRHRPQSSSNEPTCARNSRSRSTGRSRRRSSPASAR